MQIGVGYSEHPDSSVAGTQAAQMALSKTGRAEPCNLALLFGTAHHNQPALRDAVASVAGKTTRIFGGGAAGIITNEYFGYAGDQVGVACIWLDDSKCSALSVNGLENGEAAAGERLGEKLLDVGVVPGSSVLLFYDTINRTAGDMRLMMATWLLNGLEKGMGFMPEVIGAGLQGDHACTPTLQYTGEGLEKHCAISLAFSDDIRIDSVIMHGCRPASPYYTVTKVDGPVILEINGMPALAFMDKVLDSAIAPEDYPFFLLFGLNHGERWGDYDENNYASRLCLAIDKERGGIVMFEPDMVAGMEFQIMFRSLNLDYMKPKIEQAFAQLDGREPLFALYIDCAGRCAGYGGVDIEDALVIQRAVGTQVPLLGIYTGAEIAPMGGRSCGLDLTGVFCLFSKRDAGDALVKKPGNQSVWSRSPLNSDAGDAASLSAVLRLCEQNAAKVLELDSKSIAIRYELEQKRRGFRLLAELSVSLREDVINNDVFIPITQRINSALNMQKTIVLFPNETGQFVPRVLQGYDMGEKEMLLNRPFTVDAELLSVERPVLVTAADSAERLTGLRNALGLPYFISAPVVIQNEVAAILITGRLVESAPFLTRLGQSDVETVQAVSALLASVLLYHKLDDANQQAQSDDLTGLLNRRTLELTVVQELQRNLKGANSFVFLIIDCDYFKEINDTYGHMEGDKVLISLARFLRENFRASDCVARVGGDEFAVFCELTGRNGEEELLVRLDYLIKAWSNFPLHTKTGVPFSSTLSVGVSFAPRDGSTYGKLFHRADLALYRSKELGRNRYTIYDTASMKDMPSSSHN